MLRGAPWPPRRALPDAAENTRRVHLPKPDLQANDSDVFSGRTVRGNVCFEIASNDAGSLRLYVDPPSTLSGRPLDKRAWFALR
jgi:hypothetical protein